MLLCSTVMMKKCLHLSILLSLKFLLHFTSVDIAVVVHLFLDIACPLFTVFRALYQDAAVYLLDDPLSAVDAEVGRMIFDR